MKAALFDLDGVVFDTEPVYTLFWREESRRWHPEIPDLEYRIKGMTLSQIYDKYFYDVKEEQAGITKRLNDYEQEMNFDYVESFCSFVDDLRRHGVLTAVVTSSNNEKMQKVYHRHPEFKSLFDAILTSEDFTASKPAPECYLKCAARFGLSPNDCVVFEDSFNGIKSGRNAGMTVVGLATTNQRADIAPLCDAVIDDYKGMDYEKLNEIIVQYHKKH